MNNTEIIKQHCEKQKAHHKLIMNKKTENDLHISSYAKYHAFCDVLELIEKLNIEKNATNKTCWSCGITISYHENGKPHYHCVCGAVDPASFS